MASSNKQCLGINEKMNSTRVGYFDILRGIGVVLMVMGHVTFGKAFDIYIHAFHMPLFFFVSGYFFNMKKYKDMKVFIIHKAKSLLVPYTVFVLLCQVIHYVYTGDFRFSYFILSYFSSNHNRIDAIGALWFLPCLFSAEIIFYMINKIGFNKYLRITVVLLITLIGNFTPVDFPFCIDSAMSCIAVMYFGYVLKRYGNHDVLHKIFHLKWIWLVVFFVINVYMIFKNGYVNIRTNYYSNVVLYWINCISAIILYTNIANKLDVSSSKIVEVINKKVKYVGKNSLIYLLLNELMIYVVNVTFQLIHISSFLERYLDKFIKQMAVFAVCMVFLHIATEITNKTFLKIFIGKF